MYIRRTQTRSSATGEHYFTYRLVRSERIAGKVKQVTLLNLGRHFAVDPSFWTALCVRIEELMAGQASLVEVDLPTATALEAERIVEQLQLHRAPTQSASATHCQSASKPEPEAVPETDVRAMDVNLLEWVGASPAGGCGVSRFVGDASGELCRIAD